MESIWKIDPSPADLGVILDAIYTIGEACRTQIRDKVSPDDDEGMYFLGLLDRETAFADDLLNVLSHSRTRTMTTAHIIGRCIMDDFITLQYVTGAGDRKEEIYKLNAGAFAEILKKLYRLEVVNREVFGGKFPFYPTQELINEVETKFCTRPDSGNYLVEGSTPGKLKFKGSKNLTLMAEAAGSKTNDDIGRAFYFWGIWSGYVHYTPSTFGMEAYDQTDQENANKRLQELFIYLWRIVRIALKYFLVEKKIKIKAPDIWRRFKFDDQEN